MSLKNIFSAPFVTFILATLLSAYCFDYALLTMFGKDVPWYADLVVGVVLVPVCILAGIAAWVLKLAGVAMPFG